MSKINWEVEVEAKELTKKLIEKYPDKFGHINIDKIGFLRHLRKQADLPIKISAVKFPHSVWNDNVYIFIVMEDCWNTLEPKQKNIAVAQALCSLHKDGFLENGKSYGKIIKPDIVSYMELLDISGNVPNWLHDTSFADPLRGED
ncbi:MAG: putative metallopeptidase [Candidatus Methanomethylophilaceae archaeon]